MPQAM